jgi:hypothetical protein
MSTLMQPAERIAAAGCSRAAASVPGSWAQDMSGVAYAGAAAFAAAAAFRGWVSNPTQGIAVKATKRSHLTPAPRPEDGSP